MKQKRYWLRGGISLLLVYIILVFLISRGSFYVSGDNTIILSIITPVVTWFTSLHGSSPVLQLTLVYLQGLVGYFAIGALLGWIYGKIKNRNHHDVIMK